LIHCLESPSVQVRDGAGLGLMYLGDPAAISALRKAIEREPYQMMVKNFELAIEELKA